MYSAISSRSLPFWLKPILYVGLLFCWKSPIIKRELVFSRILFERHKSEMRILLISYQTIQYRNDNVVHSSGLYYTRHAVSLTGPRYHRLLWTASSISYIELRCLENPCKHQNIYVIFSWSKNHPDFSGHPFRYYSRCQCPCSSVLITEQLV